MPTFGLRLAEHVVYTQRFGGRPLYHEAYGLGASFISDKAEVHATAFAHDRIVSNPEHGDGGAIYGEARIGARAAVGVQAKYSKAEDVSNTYGGVTGKVYFPDAEILVLAEAQVVRQHILAASGDHATKLIGYVLASRPLPHHVLLDLGMALHAGHPGRRAVSRLRRPERPLVLRLAPRAGTDHAHRAPRRRTRSHR